MNNNEYVIDEKRFIRTIIKCRCFKKRVSNTFWPVRSYSTESMPISGIKREGSSGKNSVTKDSIFLPRLRILSEQPQLNMTWRRNWQNDRSTPWFRWKVCH